MKRALIGFVSVGILAVTLAAETANAQAYSPYGARRTYAAPANTPQSPRLGSPRRSARCSVCQLGQSASHGRRKPRLQSKSLELVTKKTARRP
jgi:hypothetical protein